MKTIRAISIELSIGLKQGTSTSFTAEVQGVMDIAFAETLVEYDGYDPKSLTTTSTIPVKINAGELRSLIEILTKYAKNIETAQTELDSGRMFSLDKILPEVKS